MPELPEVETIKVALADKITSKIILKAYIYTPKLRYLIDKNISNKIINQKIISVNRRAKYLTLNLSNGFLIIHLGMSGTIKIVSIDEPLKKHDHFRIDFDDLSIRLNDPRRFGAVLWSDTYNDIVQFKNLGLEPLTKKLNTISLRKMLEMKNTNIKNFLMDAKFIVGIGNIYASEILFLSKISPLRLTSTINDDEVRQICINIKKILKKAISMGGSTIRDHRLTDGSLGYFAQKLAVYGQAKKQCKLCSSEIINFTQQQRMTYYCPKCQI